MTVKWKSRKLAGYPLMTNRMLVILEYLRDCKAQGWPAVALEGINPRTLNVMARHDWIFASSGLDGVRYSITARGLTALEVYSAPAKERRYDGLCPRCGERPVHIWPSGRSDSYCLPCNRVRWRRYYLLGGGKVMKGNLCPRCKTRTRHVTASGAIRSYCIQCLRARARAERKRRIARELALALEHGAKPCIRCGERPRYHTANTMYAYCRECYRQQQAAAAKRRRRSKWENILKGKQG